MSIQAQKDAVLKAVQEAYEIGKAEGVASVPPPVVVEPPPVIEPPPVVTPPPSTVTPLVDEQYNYPDTATMLASKSPVKYDGEQHDWGKIKLMSDPAIKAGKFMRYGYTPVTSGGTTISRKIEGFTLMEIWAETECIFAPGWSLEASTSGDAAFKWFEVSIIRSGGGRYGVGMSNGNYGYCDAGGPNYSDAEKQFPLQPIKLFNGQKTLLRYHVKLNPGGKDTQEVWIRNPALASVVYRLTSVATGATGIVGLSNAMNLNKGPVKAQTLDWLFTRIYTTNPGWTA